jgi:ribosomal-protein-alanine N-acetyltransferase
MLSSHEGYASESLIVGVKLDIKLRSFRVDDVDAMYLLDVGCFEREFRFTRGAMRRFAEAKKARVVIAEESNVLVGFVILHIEEDDRGRIGYVITLDVEPAHRRRGIAGALMAEAEKLAHLSCCATMLLHVFTGNKKAIQFYENAGFVRSHRAEGFYGQGVDAWVYGKQLLPQAG